MPMMMIDHRYTNKVEHTVSYTYKIGTIIERSSSQEDAGQMLRVDERAIITGIYDVVPEAEDRSGTVTDTWVRFVIVMSAIDGALGRELEDRIENVQYVEVK